MIIRKLIYFRFFVRRKRWLLLPPLVVLLLMLWPMLWQLLQQPPVKQALYHYERNRSLQHYMTHARVLIEPSLSPCTYEVVPVIIMVASAPERLAQRQAVRKTWGLFQPTYFILGIQGDQEKQLTINRQEASQFGDIIVFGFLDHYQNLTLKTALMMKWTLAQCPQARFMMKTDDDVLVNPWMLNNVLQDHAHAELIGHRCNDTLLNRDEHNKWFIPRWLLPEKQVSKYLIGAGYLIRGDYIRAILKKAYDVPIINLEDIYYTYLVAHKELGLTVTHDRRLTPRKPWLKIGCVYWGQAVSHSYTADEMLTAWSKIENLSQQQILKKAYQVPLINIEDIYFTYIIAYKKLGLNLTHDRRLNPFKLLLEIGCVYWGYALMHGFDPEELLTAWAKIQNLVDRYDADYANYADYDSYANYDSYVDYDSYANYHSYAIYPNYAVYADDTGHDDLASYADYDSYVDYDSYAD